MSLQVTEVKGIPIKIHFTLIITFVIFAWTISNYFMPEYQAGLSQLEYWVMGIVSTGILFVSITLHELAHSLVCLKYKIPVSSITLFIFGGVSNMRKEPKDFRQEFKIAVAGPATSYAIAALFAGILLLTQRIPIISESDFFANVGPVLYYSALVNVLLGTFNLIPAFPLDGGRILRSGLVRWKKNYLNATKIAANIGIGISYGFMALGFVSLFVGSFIGGIWIILIGWFLNSGAQSYKYQFEISHALRDVKIKDIMKKEIITISGDTQMSDAHSEYFKNYLKSEFPVVENGNFIGTITSKTVREADDAKMAEHVSGHIIPKSELVLVSPQTNADKVLFEMIKKNKGRAFVVDEDGRLLGLISKTDIINLANERQEYYKDFGSIENEG